MTRLAALEALYAAVTDWRTSRCTHPIVVNGEITEAAAAAADSRGDDFCDGDNHLDDCPVELARQDVLDAHNRVAEAK